MRSALIIAVVLLLGTLAQAQEPADTESLIEGLNKAIGAGEQPQQLPDDQRERAPVVPMPSEPAGPLPDVPAGPAWLEQFLPTELPNWGVVVRDQSGEVVDLFGQINYAITDSGEVEVPGYEPPPGTRLEVIPQSRYLDAFKEASWVAELAPHFQPITHIPGAVITATDYLADALCAKRGRPTGITLSLVVSASGTIFFASAGTEAGSEVNWDFQDVCGRYGLEGEGIAFE